MDESKRLKVLVYSLELTGNFVDNIDAIGSSDEFLVIHERNISSLRELSHERGTDFYLEKLRGYPEFLKAELDEFKKRKRNDVSLFRALGGGLARWIESIYTSAKTKGTDLDETISKLEYLKVTNQSLVYAILHPGIEDLVKEKREKEAR